MSKKKSAINKTSFIKSMPNTSAADIVAAGRKKGVVFSEAYVYSVRSSAKRKKGGPISDASHFKNGARHAKATEEKRLADLVLDMGVGRAQAVIDKLKQAAAKAAA